MARGATARPSCGEHALSFVADPARQWHPVSARLAHDLTWVSDTADVYFAYVDETGIDGTSPLIVMAGIVVNDERLNRTQAEFTAIFENLGEMTVGTLRELKSSDMLAGSGAWRRVDGIKRRNVITNLCEWVCARKHDIALAAIDYELLRVDPPPVAGLQGAWLASACHMALQLQRSGMQKGNGSKGRTVLVFDDNKKGLADIADLVYAPPAWTDDYYEKPAKSPPLDRLIDTPFAVQSHHVGLIQVADIVAAVFRRYAELEEFGSAEKYGGEAGHVAEWVQQLKPRLLGKAHRWATRSTSPCAQWYSRIAPRSLVRL